jgi:hypothetical protein
MSPFYATAKQLATLMELSRSWALSSWQPSGLVLSPLASGVIKAECPGKAPRLVNPDGSMTEVR